MTDRETGSALFDQSGNYRYLLSRHWGPSLEGPTLGFIMLNPSVASEERDDPTLRRCRGFAKRWGFGSVEIVNLFAWRSPDPRAIRNVGDAVGCENDRIIREFGCRTGTVIAAWGNGGLWRGRASEVRHLLSGKELFCLGLTVCGEPRHPLYVAAGTSLIPLPTER